MEGTKPRTASSIGMFDMLKGAGMLTIVFAHTAELYPMQAVSGLSLTAFFPFIFGCGIYTVYRQTWDQFLILLVAEFLCFVLFVGATAIVEGVEKFSGWLRDLI